MTPPSPLPPQPPAAPSAPSSAHRKTGLASARRGSALADRSLEAQYGAVVSANHDALANMLDQVGGAGIGALWLPRFVGSIPVAVVITGIIVVLLIMMILCLLLSLYNEEHP